MNEFNSQPSSQTSSQPNSQNNPHHNYEFKYAAYDSKGRHCRGSINAESEKHARLKLRQQDLSVCELAKNNRPPKNSIKHSARHFIHEAFPKRLSLGNLALILEQLGVLLQSGMTLEEVLKLLVNQSENSTQRVVVASWHQKILEGHSLSQAMKNGDYTVPERVTASVAIGEETGHLASILLRAGQELELGAENRATLKRGLSYPITLLCVACVVVTILMVNVVPKITDAFANSAMELPTATKVVIGISEFTIRYGLLVLLTIALSLVLMLAWLRNDHNRLRWHRSMLVLPVLGEWQRKANLSDWARSLGTLLTSGVPALAALGISSAVMTNRHLKHKMQAVTDDVRLGQSLHAALVKHRVGQGFLQHMVGSGEASSELHTMLIRVADFYTNRLRNDVESFLKLMSPILILLLGGMVLGIVSAVMLPIIGMSEVLG